MRRSTHMRQGIIFAAATAGPSANKNLTKSAFSKLLLYHVHRRTPDLNLCKRKTSSGIAPWALLVQLGLEVTRIVYTTAQESYLVWQRRSAGFLFLSFAFTHFILVCTTFFAPHDWEFETRSYTVLLALTIRSRVVPGCWWHGADAIWFCAQISTTLACKNGSQGKSAATDPCY